MKKSRLVAWVSDETKETFKSAADQNQTTESRLLGMLIEVFLKGNPPAAVFEKKDEKEEDIKGERVTARFRTREHNILVEKAKSKGMTKAAYLAGLFRAHISEEPYFTDAEMSALRDSNRQLAALGSNINQIAKALHINPDNAALTRAIQYDAMHHIIEAHRKEVKELIKANLKSWRAK